jgi:hypothetical protein
MQKPRFKLDSTRNGWFKFAVYEQLWFIWFKVFESNDIEACEKYIEEALKLPRYYYPKVVDFGTPRIK